MVIKVERKISKIRRAENSGLGGDQKSALKEPVSSSTSMQSNLFVYTSPLKSHSKYLDSFSFNLKLALYNLNKNP